MKLEIKDGVVTVSSQTKKEATELFSQFFTSANTGVVEVVTQKVTPKKKVVQSQYVKRCDLCGKGYKGKRSMALHKSQAHGIRSKNYEMYRAWRMKRNAEKEHTNGGKTFTDIWGK